MWGRSTIANIKPSAGILMAVGAVIVAVAFLGFFLLTRSTQTELTSDPGTGGGEGNPAAWTFTEITDENIAAGVEQLPAMVEAVMERTGVPGVAVAVVRSDEVLLAQGFGVREVGKSAAVDADTVFQIASLSKPVGATVVSAAVGEGSVSWDDPVVEYLPWFRVGDDDTTASVTIGDLYSHRSGLPDHAGDLLEDLGFSREEILSRLALLPTSPLRAEYAYTNFGLTAGAEAVAAARGTTWEDMSDELLYGPAGMNDTSSRYDAYASASNRAVTHQRTSELWVPGPPRNPQPQSPAGGVSSTANDMARFLQLQLGNGTLDGADLIDADVLQIMRQPQSVSSPAREPGARSAMYGFGIGVGVDGVGQPRYSHSGAFLLGAAANIAIVPGGDIGIVVLTNGEPVGAAEAIVAEFLDIVETGTVTRDWVAGYAQVFDSFSDNPSRLAGQVPPDSPEPPGPLDEYTGTYSNDYFGSAQVAEVDGGLVMELGPEPLEFPLTHWNGDEFSYEPVGENAVGITAIVFDTDAGTMTVENLDENGLGVFEFDAG